MIILKDFSTGITILWGQGYTNGAAMSVFLPIAIYPYAVVTCTHDTSDANIVNSSASDYGVGIFKIATAVNGQYFACFFSYIAIG